ncbi:phosphatidylinositol-binding protein scs2 [Friedmanniomyces endolithicus]|uniref:Phosphatidylinositol-binding protein scs2 n=1 Tax=Friedmanniomyces endolithicus TaxID=329885 RepID=A0A4U0VI78_9PEZI|nr:phosphatidylinositol-binding protein scs2 [Friedmanniomyces endolithicus]KAK0363667.1 phosphatidylinositol-binding protein scs2 [Friedmanniomyces endolithicus]KAK0800347.1 phosphatidylinositol-binding protein scs2 [Friedmanniomyces endolithicus]KAK0806537.1 phosphatidylinositol-binding protein scs2 [Friedmanniomyces endolithicus]KAK0817205.1 phosphatidylinositol-binding protein scs2 [Friedmanniomyces endolithicus]
MSVDLEPAELSFRRPFTHEVSQVLRLHNPTADPVAFKVKTTAPKQYCVRPNSGRIEAGRSVEVSVLLQAMKEDPPPDARCRDKFLVQSVGVPSNAEFTSVTQVWTNIEQTNKSAIQEKKIRVNWLGADDISTGAGPGMGGAGMGGSGVGGSGMGAAGMGGAGMGASGGATNGMHRDQDYSPPSYSSPSPQAVTPARSTAGASGPISTPADRPFDAKSRGDAVASAYNPATGNTASSPTTSSNTMMGSAASAMSSVGIPTSQAQLQSQLEAANSRIKQMQEQATEGLRQRNIIGSKESGDGKSTGATISQSLQNAPAPGGVPVQIVAALCLLCFLIAYLFF